MIRLYKEYIDLGYIFCLPEQIKLNSSVLATYQCALKACIGRVLLKAVPASLFLEKGLLAIDDNGTPLTLLDQDLSQKLVIIEDLNLFFALQREELILNNNIWLEVLSNLPKNRKCTF